MRSHISTLQTWKRFWTSIEWKYFQTENQTDTNELNAHNIITGFTFHDWIGAIIDPYNYRSLYSIHWKVKEIRSYCKYHNDIYTSTFNARWKKESMYLILEENWNDESIGVVRPSSWGTGYTHSVRDPYNYNHQRPPFYLYFWFLSFFFDKPKFGF